MCVKTFFTEPEEFRWCKALRQRRVKRRIWRRLLLLNGLAKSWTKQNLRLLSDHHWAMYPSVVAEVEKDTIP